MSLDFARIFARWRKKRKIDYDKLDELIKRALAEGITPDALREIQELAEKMRSDDQPRFLANGFTKTTSTLDDKDGIKESG